MLKNFLARCRSKRPIAIDSRIGSSGRPSVRRVSTSNILDSISERRTSSSHARFLECAGQTNCSRSQWTTTDRDPVPAIGLELHVQLASDSKLFSSASPPSPDQQSNTNVALFDAATPGTQPNARSIPRPALIGSIISTLTFRLAIKSPSTTRQSRQKEK